MSDTFSQDEIAAAGDRIFGRAARLGFLGAADTDPDAYAKAQDVARRTGVPVDTVLAQPREMRRRDRMGGIDFEALAKDRPSHRRFAGRCGEGQDRA